MNYNYLTTQGARRVGIDSPFSPFPPPPNHGLLFFIISPDNLPNRCCIHIYTGFHQAPLCSHNTFIITHEKSFKMHMKLSLLELIFTSFFITYVFYNPIIQIDVTYRFLPSSYYVHPLITSTQLPLVYR